MRQARKALHRGGARETAAWLLVLCHSNSSSRVLGTGSVR